jgi:hypothetical protein
VRDREKDGWTDRQTNRMRTMSPPEGGRGDIIIKTFDVVVYFYYWSSQIQK